MRANDSVDEVETALLASVPGLLWSLGEVGVEVVGVGAGGGARGTRGATLSPSRTSLSHLLACRRSGPFAELESRANDAVEELESTARFASVPAILVRDCCWYRPPTLDEKGVEVVGAGAAGGAGGGATRGAGASDSGV